MEQILSTQNEVTPVQIARRPQTALVTDKQTEADAVLEALTKESRKFKRNRKIHNILVCAYIALPFALFAGHALLSLLGFPVGRPSGSYFQFFSYWYLFGGFGYASKSYKVAAEDAAGLDNIRVVGPLADALAIEDKGTRATAQGALIRLLPRLSASNADLLNDEQRASL